MHGMSWAPQTLYEVLAERAATRGDAEALVTASARLSYRDLDAAVRRAAKAMHALGVRRGDFVGILMGNDETWVTLFYAAATIGAVTVPINTRFKAAELAFCLKQADVKTLFTADRFLGIDFLSYLRAAEPAIDHGLPGAALPLLRHAIVVGTEVPQAAIRLDDVLALGASVPDGVLDDLAAKVRPDDLLLIQFTSGTTAYPKAVMLTHNNMLRNAFAVGQRLGIRHDDRYFNCRPFFHVAGTTLSLLVSLAAGACLVTLPTFEAGAALAMMAQERCTLTSGNDTLFQLMLGHRASIPLGSACAAAGRRRDRKPSATSSRRWARATSAWPMACRRPRPTSCSTTTATRPSCASRGSPSRTMASRCASPNATPAQCSPPARAARSRCAAGT
jgi:fatty-acyl-CoA synthase